MDAMDQLQQDVREGRIDAERLLEERKGVRFLFRLEERKGVRFLFRLRDQRKRNLTPFPLLEPSRRREISGSGLLEAHKHKEVYQWILSSSCVA